jgi:hypothetical protein
MIFYSITNLAISGAVRILCTSVHWKHWQVILIKIIMGGSAILYFVLGLVILLGKDSLDVAVEHFV